MRFSLGYGVNIRVCLVGLAAVSLTSCATLGASAAEKRLEIAQATSCAAPLILKYNPEPIDGALAKTVSGKALSQQDYQLIVNTAQVRARGYDTAEPIMKPVCEDRLIQTYTLPVMVPDAVPIPRLYAKAMTAEQIKADPNVTCNPTYTQIYRPSIKLGGAGRVTVVKNGIICKVNEVDGSSNVDWLQNIQKAERKLINTNILDGFDVKARKF